MTVNTVSGSVLKVFFWEEKSLEEMTAEEWELLCDGCGKCCLVKLEDEDTGEIYHTNLSCQLLDTESCRCRDYSNRHAMVDDCIQLDRDNIESLGWLPESCSYRLIAKGEPLPEWHHLICGNRKNIHEADASVAGRVISESHVHEDDVHEHIIHWVK